MKRLLLRFLLGPIPVLGLRGSSDPFQLKRKDLLKHHVHGPLQFLSEMSPSRKYNDADLVFDLRPGHEAIAWASAWLRENRLSDRKRLVAVAPGSIQPHKRWPLESFKSLLQSLLESYDDAYFLVIGTPADKELGDVLTAIEPQRIRNLAGTTSIAQSAALLQQCHLLVGNDGGAMHLGDAMGCKVVSIVPGIEFPDSIEPWHNKALAVRHPVECSPCYNFVSCPQGHNRCMTELPVERVLANCSLVLDQQ
jgi:heptosyltransferase-2